MINVELESRRSIRITVIGCGGTGSQFLPPFMQLLSNIHKEIGLGSITLVDGDFYEDKNKNNQRCVDDEIGMNKAEAMAERYGYIYEDLNVNFIADYIRTEKQLRRIINVRGYNNIVLCFVDNNATRKLIHELFEEAKNSRSTMIYLDSGNGDINRVGQIVVGYTHGGEIISRPVADYFNEILEDEEDLTKMNTCTRVASEHPQNIATNVKAACESFCVVTNILTFGKIEKNIIYFDADKHTVISR